MKSNAHTDSCLIYLLANSITHRNLNFICIGPEPIIRTEQQFDQHIQKSKPHRLMSNNCNKYKNELQDIIIQMLLNVLNDNQLELR